MFAQQQCYFYTNAPSFARCTVLGPSLAFQQTWVSGCNGSNLALVSPFCLRPQHREGLPAARVAVGKYARVVPCQAILHNGLSGHCGETVVTSAQHPSSFTCTCIHPISARHHSSV